MTTYEFPADGMELTHILVVGNAGQSRDFYDGHLLELSASKAPADGS
jgi:hypothetical protein